MGASHSNVVIIGAGCAGLSAAIGLARAGFGVVVLEAAPFPGAENWSGCVYFCENLVHPSLLGPQGLDGLAWERRLVERGFFVTNGYSRLGITYRDPEAFQHCYTVLRPIFDHHLAQLAVQAGVVLLNSTTAESLIREGDRVIGVATNRGPVYADLTFLAEGDASHLVSREGYERSSDPKHAPTFLHGIKQVIDLPPGGVEANFGLKDDEGAAYELVLRNGTLKGKPVHLNMGGFLYTNRQSLSIGLVLPADHLAHQFAGDPNLLLEWFENLPDVRRWCQGGTRGVFGAKLIRGGGAKDIPHLIDHGLAIGGAATAIGVDFPYPNFTGPATRMGLLLVEAAKAIRGARGAFTQDALRQHYLEPLQQTRYWKDVEFLRRWPGYVERTQVFFGRNVDLSLGTAYIWTRPWNWRRSRFLSWVRMLLDVAGPGRWSALRDDAALLNKALRLKEIAGRPALGRFLLNGWLNAMRDLCRRPRAGLPAAGVLRVVHSVNGSIESGGRPPWIVRRWLRRFTPILAAAARRVYANNDEPLNEKLRASSNLLLEQVNILDVFGATVAFLLVLASGGLQLGWRRLRGLLGRAPARRPERGLYPEFAAVAQQAGDLTPLVQTASQTWEDRLGGLSYQTPSQSHIHVHWPQQLERRQEIVEDGLWHLCPAHVYEARPGPQGQLQVIVNFENCIKCETCWRTSGAVDWGRDGKHRFIYAVHSPAVVPLVQAADDAGGAQPASWQTPDWWAAHTAALREDLRRHDRTEANGQEGLDASAVSRLVEKLRRKLAEFADAVAEEPRAIDRARGEYLVSLASYAERITDELMTRLRALLDDSPGLVAAAGSQRMLHLGRQVVAQVALMLRHAAQQRFAWAAADGRQVRQHHLAGLGQMLEVLSRRAGDTAIADPWLAAEQAGEVNAGTFAELKHRLDEAFPPAFWRVLEPEGTRHDGPPPELSSPQDALLLDLIAQVPNVDPHHRGAAPHPPYRKELLCQLGRLDPSMAYRAASLLWARDLTGVTSSGWSAFGIVTAGRIQDGRCFGEALFVPAAERTVLLIEDRLIELRGEHAGVRREWLATLGLRGAGLQRIVLDGLVLPSNARQVDRAAVQCAWESLSSADLIAIAYGMADLLTERSLGHALNRVQFPGLFGDDQARDTIGKFGAVKKMLAEMAARRYLIQTLDHLPSPADRSDATATRCELAKAVVAEVLGTAPGSVAYNAGQVFGGTGFSEDDVLAKLYRDASAWRFLEPSNPEVWQRHGASLLRGWRADGSSLADLPDEAELFDQVAQRKALQTELDQLRVGRTRLRSVVNAWHKTEHQPADRVLFAEALARLDGQQFAAKALLLRTHARLEDGRRSETELALLQTRFAELAAATVDFENLARGSSAPSPAAAATPPATSPTPPAAARPYEQFLATPLPYDSGDFLLKPIDFTQPRLVPELVGADQGLNELDRHYRNLFTAQFAAGRNGQSYERYVEANHRPDDADLEFLRRTGCFRFPIPPMLGGLGYRKADYYLMIQNAQRSADVCVSLTVQVNSSLGTTPILQARFKDLPKARKELTPFVGDASVQEEITCGLERLLALETLDQLRDPMLQLQNRLEETVLGRTTLRVLAHRFADAWPEAVRALKEHNLAACRAALQRAGAGWSHARASAADLLAELARREEACDFFLRLIAAGEISAFALTEPSAGSDTARVATRARLRSVPVESDAEGLLLFTPFERKERRVLFDARRVEVRPEGACYRWSPQAEPSRICADEYDYESDDPSRQRYYFHGHRKVCFSDIAQLRERGGKLWYDYWEMNGAKMWITNGRVMGVVVLYARTEEGVTGFLVDRHAEGFSVGKDERKLGQCGSPTNELALQAVRVPRENVLGLEGRGQVNALETLNVGRTGIAMSSVASLQTVVAACEELPSKDAIDHSGRRERMAQNRFIAEAIAFDVVGRFEHEQTKSVRMESAIAKLQATELLHETIELAEEVHGLVGQTQDHVIEKRKRDARVLNIYEGTNEIQRSLILRDLASEIGPRWPTAPGAAPGPTGDADLDRASALFHELRAQFGQRLRDAVQTFGATLWQNPSFQASCFLLAEAAAWLKALDSTAGRLAWIVRWGSGDRQLALRSQTRCSNEVRRRLASFDRELQRLKRGIYSPSIRAATLLFQDRTTVQLSGLTVQCGVARPLSILVIVEPITGAVPRPFVDCGRLLEPHWTLTEASQSALEVALRLRDAGGAHVRIQVAALGPKGVLPRLREVQALGADSVLLVVSPSSALFPDQAASALGRILRRRGERFDLVLGPGGEARCEEGLLTPLTAAALELSCEETVALLAVRHTDAESSLRIGCPEQPWTRSLPRAVAIPPGTPLRSFQTADYFRALSRRIELEAWPRGHALEHVHWLLPTQAKLAQAEVPAQVLSAPRAAELLLDELGVKGERALVEPIPAGAIKSVAVPHVLNGCRGLAIVAVDREGRLADGTATVIEGAQQVGSPCGVLLLATASLDAQRRAVGQLDELGVERVAILIHPEAAAEVIELRRRWLVEGLPLLERPPVVVIGESWLDPIMPLLQRKWQRPGKLALRSRRLAVEGDQLYVEFARNVGRLGTRRELRCEAQTTHWLTLLREAGLKPATVAPSVSESIQVESWSPRLERYYGAEEMQRLLAEVRQATGVPNLADADFIIDIGYGIGNRDGYDEVIPPLEQALRALGVANVAIGGSRKVTEELHVLPIDRQIGQSGVSVNPRILLAIGISGAPQHLSYIGQRATILAFNRDADSPLMTLNQRQPRPRVFGVVGDLFVTVPAFTAALPSATAAKPDVAAAPGAEPLAAGSGTSA